MFKPFPFQELHNWYIQNGRHDLPWRDYSYDTKTLSYRVWLSETMLQQTQVERVKNYFENILKAFPTVEDLANTDYEDFFPYYKWLGYYSRARNMLEAAKQVVENHNWIFPESIKELTSLKWVGPYTAEAIRAFAYNKATLSFDTNLEKIFSRYYFWNKYRKLTSQEKSEILSDFQKLGVSGRDINNALMDFGATVSLNSVTNIDWENYPLQSSKFCQTRWEWEPVKQKKISTFPNKQAYILAILHENHKIYFSAHNPPILNSFPQREKETTVDSLFPGRRDWGRGKEVFLPFLIWKNSWNPRTMIQEYFLKNYKLELSVRPPEIKSYKHEVPYMICYCQIQSGKHDFHKFPWLKVRGFEEEYVEKLKF